MEGNPQEKLFYSTKREFSNRFKSPENKSFGYNMGYNLSTKSTTRDMISPTYRVEKKEFTTTLRQGNKSSSKIRLRSANSMSINSQNVYENIDAKYSNLRSSNSKDMSRLQTNTYGDNIKKLELLIDGIKSNGFDKMKLELEKKLKIKQELEKNIERLKNSLRIHNDHTINCECKNIKLQNENSLMFSFGGRAHRELYFINKEIPLIKGEIDEMNDEISQKHEELRYIKNDTLDCDRQRDLLKEEIKKSNKNISDMNKEKENIRNGIILLKKHIEALQVKIKKQEKISQDFLYNVSILHNKSINL